MAGRDNPHTARTTHHRHAHPIAGKRNSNSYRHRLPMIENTINATKPSRQIILTTRRTNPISPSHQRQPVLLRNTPLTTTKPIPTIPTQDQNHKEPPLSNLGKTPCNPQEHHVGSAAEGKQHPLKVQPAPPLRRLDLFFTQRGSPPSRKSSHQ